MSAVISAYTTQYLEEVQKIAGMVDPAKIDRMIQLLRGVREGGGRLFILGVGGSAGTRTRRQRLPQDLRHGSLRAHRQRVGADRSGQ